MKTEGCANIIIYRGTNRNPDSIYMPSENSMSLGSRCGFMIVEYIYAMWPHCHTYCNIGTFVGFFLGGGGGGGDGHCADYCTGTTN